MRIVIMLAILFPCFTLASCGTVKGVGEDLQTGSDTVRGWF
jgi:predicted small secreted protein